MTSINMICCNTQGLRRLCQIALSQEAEYHAYSNPNLNESIIHTSNIHLKGKITHPDVILHNLPIIADYASSMTSDICMYFLQRFSPSSTVNEVPAPVFRPEAKLFCFLPHGFCLISRDTHSEAQEKESWVDRVHGDVLGNGKWQKD